MIEAAHVNSLYDSLRTITQFITIYSRMLHRQSGVTGPQLSVLMALSGEVPLLISQISRKVHLSAGTISGTLMRMEKRGLIRRDRSPEDKRKVYIQLTEAGKLALEALSSPLPRDFVQKFRAGIPEWEQNMILSAVQRLASLMQQNIAAEAPHTPPSL